MQTSGRMRRHQMLQTCGRRMQREQRATLLFEALPRHHATTTTADHLCHCHCNNDNRISAQHKHSGCEWQAWTNNKLEGTTCCRFCGNIGREAAFVQNLSFQAAEAAIDLPNSRYIGDPSLQACSSALLLASKCVSAFLFLLFFLLLFLFLLLLLQKGTLWGALFALDKLESPSNLMEAEIPLFKCSPDSNVAPNRKNWALGMWSQVGKENLTY